MNQIQKTRDYDIFNIIDFNREVGKNKINALRKDMRNNKNLCIDYPIVVDDDLNVLEGQTRYFACKEEGRTVYYKISDRLTIDDVPKANSFQKKWTMKDYLHAYISLFNDGQNKYTAYKIFSDYMESIPKLSPSTAMIILCGSRQTATMDKFQNGELTIHDLVNLEWSDQFATDLRDFSTYNERQIIPSHYWHRNFVVAFFTLYTHKRYDHKQMQDKIGTVSRMLVKCPSTEMYIELLEEFYNWKVSSPRRIRFT